MPTQRGHQGTGGELNTDLPLVVVKIIIYFGNDHFSPIFRHFSFTFSSGAREVSHKSQAVRSIQVKTITNYSLGLYVGCLRPLIEVSV